MTRAMLACVLIGACTGSSPTSPHLVVDHAPDLDLRPFVLAGQASAIWEPLGILVAPRDTVDLAECPRAWFDELELGPCAITVRLSFVPNASIGDQGGVAELGTRAVQIAEDIASWDATMSVIARELGHVAFDTLETLPTGEPGIMARELCEIIVPNDADRAFANLHTHGWTP